MSGMTAPYPTARHPASVARACGVSVRTAWRWKASGAMPKVYALGLAVLEDGDLGAMAPEWRGWIIRRDELISPEGWRFRPAEITASPILHQLVGELRRQLARPQQYDLLPG